MTHDFEAPDDADSLYRARGDEVAEYRPYLTGDVFEKVPVRTADGTVKRKNVILLMHPCAMRSNGVDLVSLLHVAEVRQHKLLEPEKWSGHFNLMPLPNLYPTFTSGRRHQAAFFDQFYLVPPTDLGSRIACLSPFGVNLLLQRYVHHCSRVVVPTVTYNENNRNVYEEADIVEEWCEERCSAGSAIDKAAGECMAFLREDPGSGRTRQEMLKDPQSVSTVRKQMRTMLKQLNWQ